MELYVYNKYGFCGVYSITSIIEDPVKQVLHVHLNNTVVNFCKDKVTVTHLLTGEEEETINDVTCVVMKVGSEKYYLYELGYDSVIQELTFLRKVV